MADEEEDIVFQFVSSPRREKEYEISEYTDRDEKREISSVNDQCFSTLSFNERNNKRMKNAKFV